MSNQVIVESLDLNDLLYLQATDASVADSRTLRKFFPEKTLFRNNEKIVFRLHGRQFIDMKCSSLRFQIKFNGATVEAGSTAYSGSILNILKRVRVVSSTGKMISDVNNHNLLSRMSSKIYRGFRHNNVMGRTYGLEASGGQDTWINGITYEFVVPMRLVSPFWNNEQLLPPQITEGLTVELYLEDVQRVGVHGGLTNYEVSNPVMICDVLQVNPSIDSAVASMSSQKMVFEYKDFVEIESFLSADSADLSLPLTYPLSNALECFVTLRDTDNVNSNAGDSFETYNISTLSPSINDQLVWRVGQLQIPQARILGGPQIYNLLVNGRNQLNSDTNTDFNLTLQDLSNTWGVYFVNLRRSNLFDNSGREVSNQQSLVAEIKVATPNNFVVNMFCLQISRIVIQNNILTIES